MCCFRHFHFQQHQFNARPDARKLQRSHKLEFTFSPPEGISLILSSSFRSPLPVPSQPSLFLVFIASPSVSPGKFPCSAAACSEHQECPAGRERHPTPVTEHSTVKQGLPVQSRLIVCWLLPSSLHRHEEAKQSSGCCCSGRGANLEWC